MVAVKQSRAAGPPVAMTIALVHTFVYTGIVDPGLFEWDPKKNRVNQEKHAIDFTDAIAIFAGACVEGPDERFDYVEPRMIAYGQLGTRVIAVVYC